MRYSKVEKSSIPVGGEVLVTIIPTLDGCMSQPEMFIMLSRPQAAPKHSNLPKGITLHDIVPQPIFPLDAVR